MGIGLYVALGVSFHVSSSIFRLPSSILHLPTSPSGPRSILIRSSIRKDGRNLGGMIKRPSMTEKGVLERENW